MAYIRRQISIHREADLGCRCAAHGDITLRVFFTLPEKPLGPPGTAGLAREFMNNCG